MIFIVLGTQKFSLNRLLKEMDSLIEEGKIQEKVFAQIGNSTYTPKNYEYVDFLSKDEFEKKMLETDIVIAHGGVGTVISAVNKRKPVLVYPRLSKYNEHVDNHQLQIAESFQEVNLVLVCHEDEDLLTKIKECRKQKFDTYESKQSMVVATVNEFLDNL